MCWCDGQSEVDITKQRSDAAQHSFHAKNILMEPVHQRRATVVALVCSFEVGASQCNQHPWMKRMLASESPFFALAPKTARSPSKVVPPGTTPLPRGTRAGARELKKRVGDRRREWRAKADFAFVEAQPLRANQVLKWCRPIEVR